LNRGQILLHGDTLVNIRVDRHIDDVRVQEEIRGDDGCVLPPVLDEPVGNVAVAVLRDGPETDLFWMTVEREGIRGQMGHDVPETCGVERKKNGWSNEKNEKIN
jgi:hypothetical protein